MHQLLSVLFIATIFMSSCTKNNCDEMPPSNKCNETATTIGTTCMAYFESWFYDEATGTCEKKEYSGCEKRGFDSEEECKKCNCNNKKLQDEY